VPNCSAIYHLWHTAGRRQKNKTCSGNVKLLEHAAINFMLRRQKVDIASAELYFSLLGCQVEKVTGFIEILSFHSSPGSVVQQCVVQTDTREIKKFGSIFSSRKTQLRSCLLFHCLIFVSLFMLIGSTAKLSPQTQAACARQICGFSVRKTNLPITLNGVKRHK